MLTSILWRPVFPLAVAVLSGLGGCETGKDNVLDGSGASVDGGPPDSELPDVGPRQGNCSEAGVTRCRAAALQVCAAGEDGVLNWGPAHPCPAGKTCAGNECSDPSASQQKQLGAVANYVAYLKANTAWSEPLDWAGLLAQGTDLILQGDGTPLPYLTAMRLVLLGVPQGHQSLLDGNGGCSIGGMPPADSSRFGVCGRPHGQDIVVTYAASDNPLGLRAGDLVTAAGTDSGADLLEAAARRPVCGASSPTASHRRTSAAASFFATVPVGTELTIKPVDGSPVRTQTVPPPAGKVISCQDPFARDIHFNAQASLRPDGIAVIRLPRFYPWDQVLPSNPTQQEYDAFIDAFRQSVGTEFDKVKTAPAIIWDARSNYGGISPIALEIVGGMPTAKPLDLSYCTGRITGSDPPTFGALRYAEYSVSPGGRFAYPGKIAVLIDGLDYSAADYFALAVHRATAVPLVGTPSAGAYGGPGPLKVFQGDPPLAGNADLNRCVDAATGEPLEGKPTTPDVQVEYDPMDLAAGRDTVLDAALQQLHQP